MRITGGMIKGRRLTEIKGRAIRPTSDRVRSSIFNILGHDLTGLSILDLFAGTGSLGIECLSRGATRGVFIDKSSGALALIKKNITLCGFEAFSALIREELPMGLTHIKTRGYDTFDLVFMDPPYESGYIEPTLHMLVKRRLVSHSSKIVVESSTNAGDLMPPGVPNLHLDKTRSYGSTVISFYSCDEVQ